MANTRKIDREIRNAKAKRDRLQAQDSTALSAADQAKLAGLGVVAFARATRLRSAPGAERAADRIWTRAQEDAAADVSVLEAERAQAVNDEAAARRAKKAGGWF